MNMRLNKYIVYLFSGMQLICGLFFIYIPLNVLPHIHVLTKEPTNLLAIIDAIKLTKPSSIEIQQAAELLAEQQSILSSIGSSADEASYGLICFGVFQMLSGIVLFLRQNYGSD